MNEFNKLVQDLQGDYSKIASYLSNFKDVETMDEDSVSLFNLSLEEFDSVDNYDKVLNNINRTIESLN